MKAEPLKPTFGKLRVLPKHIVIAPWLDSSRATIVKFFHCGVFWKAKVSNERGAVTLKP